MRMSRGHNDDAVSWYERNASTGALSYGGMLMDGAWAVWTAWADGACKPRASHSPLTESTRMSRGKVIMQSVGMKETRARER